MNEKDPASGDDDAENVRVETVYESASSREISEREAEIKAMLGSRLKVDMDELAITIDDYSSDFKIVFDHFCDYLLGKKNLSVINSDGTRQWKRKSSGLLRNFLVSRMALRDHTYALVKKYWKPTADDPRTEHADFMRQYEEKVESLLIKPQFKFLQDLRNFGVHKALYPFNLHTKFAGGYMQNDIRLDRDQLLETYDSWTAPAKKYIQSHTDGGVDLLTPMEEWSTACRTFYEWFHGAVTLHHMEDFEAVEAAWESYREWRRETGTMPPDWVLNNEEPPWASKPSTHKTRDAKMKRKRKKRKRR